MNTLTFVSNTYKEQLDEISIHQFRSDFFANGIKCFYEFSNIQDGIKNCVKVILTQNKTVELNKELKNPLVQIECSGLVLQQYKAKWTVLAKPPVLTKTNITNTVYCNNLLISGVYDIIEIRDGTVVTLYYDTLNNQWLMSSTNSISVGKTILDELSFEDGFSQSLKKVLNTEYKDLLEVLDKKKSWTFGFKNPALHPFNDEWDFWFVQSADVSALDDSPLKTDSTSKIDTTSKIENKTESTLTSVPESETKQVMSPNIISFKPPIDNMNVQVPIKLNLKTHNLGTFFKKAITSLDTFIHSGNKFYGYILRHKDINQKEPNYLIESSLMSKIRKSYYFNDYTKCATMLGCSRKEYVLANAFLTNRKLFSTMFPGFNKTFSEYDMIVNNLVNKVMKIASAFFKTPVGKSYAALVKKNSTNENKTSSDSDETESKMIAEIESGLNKLNEISQSTDSSKNSELQLIDNTYHTFASKIYIQISQKITVKNANEEFYRNFYEYIMSPHNISIFINLHNLHTKTGSF